MLHPIRRLALAVALLLSGASTGRRDPAEPGAITFGRIHENRVEILDLRQGTWRPIYQAPTSGITDLSVAPSGDRLALLSWTQGTFAGHDYAVAPEAELVVIDTSGRTLARIPGAHKYDWCGSNCLVYLLGEYSEDSDWGFVPDGRLGLLEVGSGKTRTQRGPRYPISVVWNPLDSAVYLHAALESPAIYRLDLSTGTLRITGLHDIQFSPSGRYYLSRRLETDSIEIYETRTNAQIDISAFLRTARPVGWAGPSGDVLLAVRHVPRPPRKPGERPRVTVIKPSDIRPQRYVLYRLSDGRVLAEEQGFLHEPAGSADRRLIRQGEKYKVLEGR